MTIAIKYEVMKSHMDFRLVYLYLTLANCKVQGHSHAHMQTCEYLASGDRKSKHCYCQQIESHTAFP